MVSGALGIGITGLDAARQALDVISHNIANANTTGYNRQVIDFATRDVQATAGGYMGLGVDVSSIRRITDELVTKNLQIYTANYHLYDTYSTQAVSVEKLLADSSSSISEAMSAFFVSLQQANAYPDSVPVRQGVINAAKDLVARFSNLDTQFNNLNNSINRQLDELVTKINTLTASIAEINQKIVDYSNAGAGSMPNDLLDKRDEYIRQLAEVTQVSTAKQSDGSMNVFLDNGIAVVVGSSRLALQTKSNDADPTRKEIAMNANGTAHEITSALVGGSLGGLLSVRTDILDLAWNGLGRLALSFANTVNQQHQLGIDYNGTLGGNLFNDVNAASAMHNRALADSDNTGNAVVTVSINDIVRASTTPYSVYGAASNLVNTGALDSLSSGELKINGVAIRATVSGDDTSSSVDNAASAIATAAAINASTAQHKVTATAQKNVLYLGAFTAGAFTAGQFTINGVNVVTAGTNETVLLADINALSDDTGVTAFGDGSGNITLVASDGRNIRLTSDTSTPTATFSLFNTASATALDKIQRAGVTLTSTIGSIAITGNDPGDVGLTAGTAPNPGTSLTTSNYELTYNGSQYVLTRLSDNTVVASSSSTSFTADGMTVSIASGTMTTADRFTIKPTRFAIHEFALNITDPKKLAFASPVSAAASSSNNGSGSIEVTKVLDTSGSNASTAYKPGNAFGTAGALGPPLRLVFTSATTYKLYDVSNGVPGSQIGPEMTYDPAGTDLFPFSGVVNKTGASANAPFTWDPGYRVKITGTVSSGDVFTIQYNSNSKGDNRNGVQLAQMQFEQMFESQNSTYTDLYANLVGDIGSNTGRAIGNREASSLLLQATQNKRDSLSGVDLDEEAANLMKFQQAYQACAQVIAIARSTFDALISAVRG